jgi:uncharacterized membrane protein YdcZ (DUF606 family)
LAFATLVTAVLSCGVLLAARQSFAGYGDGLRAPLWLWSAGIMGLVVILSITYATPRIGATAAQEVANGRSPASSSAAAISGS